MNYSFQSIYCLPLKIIEFCYIRQLNYWQVILTGWFYSFSGLVILNFILSLRVCFFFFYCRTWSLLLRYGLSVSPKYPSCLVRSFHSDWAKTPTSLSHVQPVVFSSALSCSLLSLIESHHVHVQLIPYPKTMEITHADFWGRLSVQLPPL